MKVKYHSRFLAMMLALVMVVSMLPVSAFAAETADHVVISQAYGGGGNSGSEYTNDFVELYNPTDTDVSLKGWSIQYASATGKFGNNKVAFDDAAVIKAGGYYLVQLAAGSGGTTALPTPDAEGSISMSATNFKVALANNTEAVTGVDDENVVDFLGAGTANAYEGTKAAPAGSATKAVIRNDSGVDTDDNAADFSADAPTPRNSSTAETPTETTVPVAPTETTAPAETTAPVDPSEPEATVSTIAEALAGADGTSFTVKGVVTLVDGKNIYVQDATGAICVYMSAAPSDIALGDTIIATGTRGAYSGLEQLSSGTYEKSEGLTLTATEKTIAELTTADVAHYITIKGLTVTAVSGNALTLVDGAGSTIVTYKSVLGDTAYAVGDVIDFTGALGIYKTTLQLRNTLATEITKWSISTIAEALAGASGTEFTVKGVVTLVDGRNIYIQDNTDAICVYMAAAPSDISLGDTIVGTGKRGAYSGLEQLSSSTYIKSAGLTLTAAEKTIGELTAADVAHYITIKNLEITAISGTALTLKDDTDATIVTYKSVLGDTAYAVGDKINFTGALGIYKTTLQLRNTLATEIEKTSGGSTEPDPTDPTDPSEPEATVSTIAEALAGADGTSFTVKGVVTLVDGSNIYVQDATGGICVRMSSAPSDIALGDTIIGTGSKTVYKGLPQLGSGTYEKSEGLTLEAKEVSDLSALTTADIGCYIKLVNMEIVEIYDNNGAYASPNITVKDANGNQIQLYKAVTTKTDGVWDWAVGDKVNISGGMSVYNTTLQLRNTLSTEIEEYVPFEVGKVTSADKFETGSYVMVVSTGYAPGVLDGTWVTAVQPVIEGDKVTDPAGGIMTLTVNGSSVEICDANGIVISPVGGNTNGIKGAAYQWTWAFDEATATFTFSGVGADTVMLCSNKGNDGKFRAYKTTTATGSNAASYPHDFTLYRVDPAAGAPEVELPKAGDQVVIYNSSAQGVLAAEGDNQVITNALATVADGKAICANGGVVFTIEQNGDYFRFYNETYGYLCSGGTGNNAFYSLEATDDADWKLTTGKKGGYNLESRTAKYNGTYSQFLEYYSDSYKSYSMYNVTDYDIYEFFFYPVAEGTSLTGGIVNMPAVVFPAMLDAYIGVDYTFTFEVDAVFGVKGEPTVMVGEDTLTANEDGSYTIPMEKITGESLTITVTGVDTKDVAFTGSCTVTVLDKPVITDMTPAAGFETMDDKRPTIEATIVNAGEGATVTMTVSDETVAAVYENGKLTYTPAADLPDGRTTVTVTVTRADGETAEETWTFTVGKAQYQLYFGQLHSHTTYSDGSGTLESALDYINTLPESANVDFVAFTDHSNYFDASGAANPEGALYDTTLATADSMAKWNAYVKATHDFNASGTNNGVIAIPGYEMTWSGGPGHINTFNTPGIVSRNNSVLNNKTGDAGMQAYYALLKQAEGVDTINQFNHPGTTFGTFADFAYWDPVIDSRIQLVEVGNGEGAIGAGGYFPSYEYYTMALDKGWHVAPTNNQDNHKGKWGNANDARDVILTDDFSLEGLQQAIRDLRVYATEDKNLQITYTVNGMQLGSSLSEVPEELNLKVTVFDPDASDSISKVEVIVNSGKVAYTWNDPSVLAKGTLEVTLAPNNSYYYIRVTQGDGDLAVTAPVWVGEPLMLGLSDLVCGTSMPVTGEELTLTATVFNSEKTDAVVKSITYAYKNGAVIGTDSESHTVTAGTSLDIPFKYTPTDARVVTLTATVVMENAGQEYIFSKDIELDIQNPDKLVYIGIDAAHYNEYVAGNYKDSMGNFSELAVEYAIRCVQLNTSEELIAACSNPKYKALILTAPSRRLAAAQSDPRTYTEAELAAIKAFNEGGGTVILAGWSDNYENYPVIQGNAEILHMAAAQNTVLEALGSSLRIADDATYDDSLNGGQAYRLYFNAYGDSFLTEGVEVDPAHPNDRLYTEVFSQYGGASIYVDGSTMPGTVTPVVFGHTSTYSVDVDKDGLGGDSVPKYTYAEGDNRLMVMATEQLSGKGLIVVSGAAFMSNFEVQATVEDSGAEKNYSNYKICENLLAALNPVEISPISAVQAETNEGVKFTIEGIVTSNASGYDKATAFFDCIYLQDETAGINAFPVAGNFKIGDKVRITGITSSYQGERQIAVSKISLISENNPVEPKEVTAAQINDGSVLGSLITLKGTVTSFQMENGLVQTIMVKDAAGKEARVFIDGYISTAKDVENLTENCEITVTGLASYDDTFNAPEGPFARIRIRNREDIVCTPSTAVVIKTQPTAQTVESGENAIFAVVAEGTVLKYQWQWRAGPNGTWASASAAGNKTATLTVSGTPARHGFLYRCVVTDALGNEVISDEVKLTVNSVPVIDVQPVDTTADEGTTAILSVKATGSGLKYQWQWRAGSNGAWANATASGNKTANLNVPAAPVRNGFQYRCVITDTFGNEVVSDTAILTVKAELVLKTQPVDLTLEENASGKFTVVASGSGLQYQWEYRMNANGKWANALAAGNKTATLTVQGATFRHGMQYRCKITDAFGEEVYSDIVTLTVNSVMAITGQPTSQTVAVGENAKFAVVASGSGLTYQWEWRANADGKWANALVSGNKTATLTVPGTESRNGFQYRCVITDGFGNVAYSDVVTLTVK